MKGTSLHSPSRPNGEILIPTDVTRELYRKAFEGCELVVASAMIQSENRTKTHCEKSRVRIESENPAPVWSAGARLFRVHKHFQSLLIHAKIECRAPFGNRKLHRYQIVKTHFAACVDAHHPIPCS